MYISYRTLARTSLVASSRAVADPLCDVPSVMSVQNCCWRHLLLQCRNYVLQTLWKRIHLISMPRWMRQLYCANDVLPILVHRRRHSRRNRALAMATEEAEAEVATIDVNSSSVASSSSNRDARNRNRTIAMTTMMMMVTMATATAAAVVVEVVVVITESRFWTRLCEIYDNE